MIVYRLSHQNNAHMIGLFQTIEGAQAYAQKLVDQYIRDGDVAMTEEEGDKRDLQVLTAAKLAWALERHSLSRFGHGPLGEPVLTARYTEAPGQGEGSFFTIAEVEVLP